MLVPAVGAFEWDSFVAGWGGLVITSFDTALISTSVGVAGVGGGADGAGRGGFFAKLGRVSKFAAVAALGDERGRKHLLTLAGRESRRMESLRSRAWSGVMETTTEVVALDLSAGLGLRKRAALIVAHVAKPMASLIVLRRSAGAVKST